MPRSSSKDTSDTNPTAAPAEVDTKAARVAMLVPAHARANYAQMVKDRAAAGDLSEDEARAQQLDVWRAQHEQDPHHGWDVLADWLESADLDEPELYSQRVEPVAEDRVRAVQAAKAEFDAPLDGFNEAEVASILAHREAVKAGVTEVLPDTNAPAADEIEQGE